MNCRKVRETVFLFTDNEMEESLLVSFRRHLEYCPGCAQRIEYTQRVIAIVKTRCRPASVPAGLRDRILASLPHRRSSS